MKKTMSTPNRQTGFTLIEIAMVMLIIVLILGGLLPTISAQMEQQRINTTRRQLNEIREALLGFAVANNRLPCPANGTANSGQEDRNVTTLVCNTITGNASGGVLPWATLGVSETDAWGRRFTYRVTSAFADGADGTSDAGASTCPVSPGVSWQMCSTPNLNVYATTGGVAIATNLPAVVVSHGTNGLGAYTSQGTKIAGAANDELTNSSDNNNFVSRDAGPNFDDLVVWLPPNVLLSRMIAAGKLP